MIYDSFATGKLERGKKNGNFSKITQYLHSWQKKIRIRWQRGFTIQKLLKQFLQMVFIYQLLTFYEMRE